MLKVTVNGQKFFVGMQHALLTYTFDSDNNGTFDKIIVTGCNQIFLIADWNAARLLDANTGVDIGANPYQV